QLVADREESSLLGVDDEGVRSAAPGAHRTLDGASARRSPPQVRSDPAQRSARVSAVPLALALRAIQMGPLAILLAIWLGFSTVSPYFLTSSNLTNVLVQASSVALLALGALAIVIV